MGEQIPTPVTNNEPQPVDIKIQEPTPIVEVIPPVIETPKAEEPKPEGGQPNVIELLSTVDSGTLLKSEVVQGLVESARQQEKNKLYKTIEEKDNTNKQLQQTITDLQTQLKLKEETTMDGEKELLAQIQAMQEKQDQLIKQMDEEKEKTRLAELASYRKSKIAEAKGEIIESLVKGNTEEEVNASYEVAVAEYQKIVSPYKQKVEELGKPDVNNAPKPSNPSTPVTPEFTSEQIKAMSHEDYAKYRESVMKSIKG